MGRPSWLGLLVGAVALVSLASGCAEGQVTEDQVTEVVVDVRVTVCVDECRDLAASGVEVSLLGEGGDVAERATTDDRGRAGFTPQPGSYSVVARDAPLGLSARLPSLQVGEGEAVDYSVVLGTLDAEKAS